MWYFTWALGIAFAVLLAILNVLWMEHEDDRKKKTDGVEG
ncbi:MAG: cytochrome bd-I oxidase subunit CydX [Azoarcus sp.]|jgi:cyd operon protein YbgT|nr:cytochrome bd-I oxidase subunit CydX [Azoarcus sp.]